MNYCGRMWIASISCGQSCGHPQDIERHFSPFFRYAQTVYPHFLPLKSRGIRRFVNISVDNAPSYPRLTHSSTLTYPQGYPQIVDNVDYGYKISCGKHKNRTGICTRAADSVDKLWINRKSAHGRHGQRQTGKPRQSGIFPEKNCENY